MSPFANQVVLVTGAASGLGRQLALNLAIEGAIIAAVDLQAEGLGQLANELGGKACAWAVADVTNFAALHEAADKLQDRLGPVELLIGSAGIGVETSALDFRAADFEAVVRVNLIGVANSVAAVLPGMLARRRGHLVAISSLASFRGLPRMAGYCAAKAGVNALMESLRFELKPSGIAVTSICPGWIRTPMTANLKLPMPNILELEDAARSILDAIRRRRPLYAFPWSSAWRVRLLRWLPPRLGDWLMGRMLRALQAKE
jgi:NAD(P)-dependent dehydrogenase (short-subunit alcohol dehydrogenase family)